MIRYTGRYMGWLLLASTSIFLLRSTAHPQNKKNAFVGVWEETHDIATGTGKAGTGNLGMHRIFTADGFYSITFGRQCAGTQVVATPPPLREMTKEQILDRIGCVIAQDGIYTVDGDKLNITRRSDNIPQRVVSHQVMQWKVENGELSLKILSDMNGPVASGQVTYYKRLKPGELGFIPNK